MAIHETSTEEEKQAFFGANPTHLYKYRIWDDQYHKKVLLNTINKFLKIHIHGI